MNLSIFRLSHPVEKCLLTLIIFRKVEEVKLKRDFNPPRFSFDPLSGKNGLPFFRLGYLFLDKAHHPKFNMKPEHDGFPKTEYLPPAGPFSGSMLVFGGFKQVSFLLLDNMHQLSKNFPSKHFPQIVRITRCQIARSLGGWAPS